MKLQLVDANFDDVEITSKEIPPQCMIQPPKIYLSERARTKIHAIAVFTVEYFKENLEVFCYVLGEEMGVGLDIVLPSVEVTGGYGEVTPDNIRSIKPEIAAMNEKRMKKNEERMARNEEIKKENEIIRSENEKIRELNVAREEEGLDLLPEKEEIPLLRELKPLMIIGWAHSHGNMDVFFSQTDKQQQDHLHRELSLGKLMDQAYHPTIPKMFHTIGMTVNTMGHEFGAVKGSLICGLELALYKNVDIIQIETDDDCTEEELREELRELRKEVPKKVKLLRNRIREKPRYIEPIRPMARIASRESTLEKYFKTKPSEPGAVISPDSELVEKLRSCITVDEIKKDELVSGYFKNIEEAYKGKPKTLKLITKIIHNTIDRACKIAVDMTAAIENELYGTEKEIVEEPEKEPVDECASCGTALGDDNFAGDYDVNGNPVCAECDEKLFGGLETSYCSVPGCNKRLTRGTKFVKEDDDDDDHFCFEHYYEHKNALNDEEEGNRFDYFDDDGNPTHCVRCNKKLDLGQNYEQDQDDDGMPLCMACASPPEIDEDDGSPEVSPPSGFTPGTERRDPDPQYIS